METTTIPVSELQAHATKLVERVKNRRNRLSITLRGRPAALLLNWEEYEGLVATLEEMSQPDWRDRLVEAERDSKARRGITLEEFKARRAKRARKG